MTMLAAKEDLEICFAHAAYRLREHFLARGTGIRSFEVRTREALEAQIGAADVLVISGLWQDALLEKAGRLRFIQSISAGVDQYGREALARRGVRLASAHGANARAVAEHAMALVLALARRLAEARDNQARKFWRGMIGDPSAREGELGGKTMLIVGLGRIGSNIAGLAKAFGMTVLAIKRDPASGAGAADQIVAPDRLASLVGQADFVVLSCPLTAETTRLIDASVLARFRPSAFLVNVARGRCVDEPALIEALEEKRLAGAALDCAEAEPLPPTSPLWTMPNVLITPHTAGETQAYEDNVLDLLLENLDRLWRGETVLRNQIV
ncbi:MAG TPA: D-2-hydroxyacid dehydrogenase [Candidatus Binataceae bacterium]|nr:D-2-hydroxyacid dehydrogenase [Candidatus Binataceae bacterium]